jgi:hypothetical protein
MITLVRQDHDLIRNEGLRAAPDSELIMQMHLRLAVLISCWKELSANNGKVREWQLFGYCKAVLEGLERKPEPTPTMQAAA